jgi:hypothetical protein
MVRKLSQTIDVLLMYYLGATERYSLRKLQIEEVQVRSEPVRFPY